MARKVKEFVRIDRPSTLNGLIDALIEARAALPADAEADLSLRGCDVFGRHIAIAYMRPQTEEEAATEARYAEAVARMLQRQDEERRTVKPGF